jgi:hypothetical protein
MLLQWLEVCGLTEEQFVMLRLSMLSTIAV